MMLQSNTIRLLCPAEPDSHRYIGGPGRPRDCVHDVVKTPATGYQSCALSRPFSDSYRHGLRLLTFSSLFSCSSPSPLPSLNLSVAYPNRASATARHCRARTLRDFDYATSCHPRAALSNNNPEHPDETRSVTRWVLEPTQHTGGGVCGS